MKELKGLLLPTTTPFGREGEIDFPSLKANLDRWSGAGVSGFVLLGSTGERVHLDDREYLQTIETARAVVSTDLAFIVGAGQR
jgi:dihydrodipicolinate synthase/N-acetylneuraminate lyase